MTGPRYYDRDGTPMPRMAWAKAMNDHEYRRIAHTDVGDVTVSTIWIGLDHQVGEGPPLIFETMVFGGKFDEYMERYSTEDEAHAGHLEMVQRVLGEGSNAE